MTFRFQRGAKYKNSKISHAGYSFASKLEASLFDQLRLLEMAGEISSLKCQDVVYLTNARIMYKPDFRYFHTKMNRLEWAEAKGFETSDWRIKRRLWEWYGPGPLHIWNGSAGRLTLKETLIP